MRRTVFVGLLATLLCTLSPLHRPAVAADGPDGAASRAEAIEKENEQYAQLYAGTLNVYLSIAEAQSGKASLQKVKFDGIRSAGNSRFFRFTDGTGTWLLEPKMIYAVKVLRAE